MEDALDGCEWGLNVIFNGRWRLAALLAAAYRGPYRVAATRLAGGWRLVALNYQLVTCKLARFCLHMQLLLSSIDSYHRHHQRQRPRHNRINGQQ